MQNYQKEFLKKFLKKVAPIPGQFAIIKPRWMVDKRIDEILFSLNNPNLFNRKEVNKSKYKDLIIDEIEDKL